MYSYVLYYTFEPNPEYLGDVECEKFEGLMQNPVGKRYDYLRCMFMEEWVKEICKFLNFIRLDDSQILFLKKFMRLITGVLINDLELQFKDLKNQNQSNFIYSSIIGLIFVIICITLLLKDIWRVIYYIIDFYRLEKI